MLVKKNRYRLSLQDSGMLFCEVNTPDGTGTVIDVFENYYEVKIGKSKDFYPKESCHMTTEERCRKFHDIFLSNSNTPSRLNPPTYYQDAFYQAQLIEAANTFEKKRYVKGEISLNQYREHEKKIYGTINA